MNEPEPIHVVGGGLAGAECAYQLAQRGLPVVLHEMRPRQPTPAHKTGDLAELVCSNSLRSDDPLHAAGLLKREMEGFGSLIIAAARAAAVPAGSALAVDRERFSAQVTAAIAGHPAIELRREEVTEIPRDRDVVLATGPLSSAAMSGALQALLGSEYLYFYDAIAPIVEAESLDLGPLFWQSRYGKGDGDDYLNAPLSKEQYLAFHAALSAAEVVAPHEFEQAVFFEGCLPIEELARRGVETLRYGPMKPVGLRAPDGRRPWAVVQLRQENLARSHFNLVGFQSRMKWGEQQRVLRMIPGLDHAEFVRFGQIHRNTFINAPRHLDQLYRVKSAPRVRLAGQITGVEGYLESAATGLAIALYLAQERQGREPEPLPATTALGALARHLTESDPRYFQPANINYGLFTELPARLHKTNRRAAFASRAAGELAAWAARSGIALRFEPLAPAAAAAAFLPPAAPAPSAAPEPPPQPAPQTASAVTEPEPATATASSHTAAPGLALPAPDSLLPHGAERR
ncbi:MAG TPA: methylenetetrahydrofolate--tRNA-(uracil(54)-C(5))-methyltransferase (FADH(2)-oxidizing) TrmFO [Thermoanaerobaculia bacterium]|nr:methylenetetrahydrofolate--tRNA-(uracil(54)-C(5))-methyltransferase (FADH(2)-oxidizing) TrmFO [Thermoanaerobaculia bacterium]